MNHQELIFAILGLPLAAIGTLLVTFQYPRVSIAVHGIYTVVWLSCSVLMYGLVQDHWVIELGGWRPPYGITLVVDKPAAMMHMALAIVVSALSLYSVQDMDLHGKRTAYYLGFWLLLLGLSGVLLTHDLFNLYVYSEIMLISAFITLACTAEINFKAIFHYAVLNIFATLIMLLAIAILYAQTGSLNYTSLATDLAAAPSASLLGGLLLLLFALGIKGGLFPLYFWLPTAYPATSYSSTMLLASVVTKSVLFVLLRLTTLWPVASSIPFQWGLAAIAGATMLVGVMGAAYQYHIRAILSFHIISQLGYVLLAVTMSGISALMAALYFLIHNIFVKTGLFMISGYVENSYGTDYLPNTGRVIQDHPWLSVAFLLSALSLAGLPPFSGFWGKLLILKTALSQQYYLAAATALIVSLLTLYSMIKIWRLCFCQSGTGSTLTQTCSLTTSQVLALTPFIVIPLIMGLNPDLLLTPLSESAAPFGQLITTY